MGQLLSLRGVTPKANDEAIHFAGRWSPDQRHLTDGEKYLTADYLD
jgi:hypothetical protein